MAEQVLLIAVKLPEQKNDRFDSSLEELASLSETAGGNVQGIITQKRQRKHPANYIGEGKLDEITEQIEALDIDLVVANDELSPGQLRNLSNYLEVRVIDRSQLILDIFAQRAHTKEGKLQVELAQLQYLLPRLHGQGEAMSRLGGGIGTRGPGETKLESDRRHIMRRIDAIKHRLKLVVRQREQYRKRRKTNETFQIAIVGYTNAGKSTLFNRLTESQSLEENQLFATLDPLTRQIQLPSGFQALVTDTVGFIQDLPTSLIASFRSTLEEVTEADFILHVLDAANSDIEQHQDTVENLLHELNAHTIPSLMVYNKNDLVKDFIPLRHPNIMISAYNDQDIYLLQQKIEEVLQAEWESYHVEISPEQSSLLYQLERETIVRERYFAEDENYYHVSGYMRPETPLKRLIKE